MDVRVSGPRSVHHDRGRVGHIWQTCALFPLCWWRLSTLTTQTLSTSSSLEMILKFNCVMHRQDLDILNHKYHNGMLNLETGICDHSMLKMQDGTCNRGMLKLRDGACDHGNAE